MVIRKSTFKFLPARKLRSIASGKFLGIKSSTKEIRLSKAELKLRGLNLIKRRRF